MGAERFDHFEKGIDVQTAFRAAVDDAAYEYGHGGYTGTIAEKTEYTVVSSEPVTLKVAEAQANALHDNHDERVNDKWGTCAAIRVKDDDHDGWLFTGWASS